jgi:hypothetical protein
MFRCPTPKHLPPKHSYLTLILQIILFLNRNVKVSNTLTYFKI